jgi:hypothetical protein
MTGGRPRQPNNPSVLSSLETRDVLIAACWAADIRIIRSESYAHMVIVDVIRRPPDHPPVQEPDRLSWPG